MVHATHDWPMFLPPDGFLFRLLMVWSSRMIRGVLAAGAAVMLATAGLAYVAKHHEITFLHLRDAKTRLLGAGFICTSDRADGTLATGFLISRQSSSWSEAGTLCKVGPMGPEWKGKVWVTFNSNDWRLASLPEHAGMRVWGTVIAYGDEEFLSEIDGSLAPVPFSFL
jgi:hypothetical protein